jgi:hypothetical protein
VAANDEHLAVWPKGPLPDGTDLRTWLRAASKSGLLLSTLLRENSRVQAAHYQAAEASLAAELLAERTTSSDPWATAAGVPNDPTRWNAQVTAEATVTEALRKLQDNEVTECMVLLVKAASQVFEVVLMDRNEQKVVEK